RLFGGEAVSCSGEVLQKGRPITKEDGRLVKDNVGLVAGDEVFASYRFASGAHGNFISHAGLKDYSGHWGLELRGTKGAVRITTDIPCQVFIQERTKWDTNGRTVKWQRPEELAAITPEQRKTGPVEANRIMVV